MDKAVKIPLMALSVLTTQLVVLLGNTTIGKSAEHKPTGYKHIQISQTYYDRQIRIESMPSMHNQQKETELRSQSFSDRYDSNQESENQRSIKCSQQTKYYMKIGYGVGSSTYYIGKKNEVYEWNVTKCKSYLKGYADGRTTGERGEPCDYNATYGAYCFQWKLEGNKLCEYKGWRDGRVVRYCDNKN